MDYTEQLILFVVAFLANWFSALAGGGAGLIQLPALIFLGLPFPLALATHKIATVALGAGATLRHVREGHLNRSEEHTSELQSRPHLVCRLLLEKKKKKYKTTKN